MNRKKLIIIGVLVALLGGCYLYLYLGFQREQARIRRESVEYYDSQNKADGTTNAQ